LESLGEASCAFFASALIAKPVKQNVLVGRAIDESYWGTSGGHPLAMERDHWHDQVDDLP
jgi:hypothetical protein